MSLFTVDEKEGFSINQHCGNICIVTTSEKHTWFNISKMLWRRFHLRTGCTQTRDAAAIAANSCSLTWQTVVVAAKKDELVWSLGAALFAFDCEGPNDAL